MDKKTKLNFHFHNPNTVEDTAKYILKIFIDANKCKVDTAITEATYNNNDEKSLA